MLTRIHVNQHHIRANKKDGGHRPVLSVKRAGKISYCSSVQIEGPATVIYSPDKPLSCGARVWIETAAEVTLGEPNCLAADLKTSKEN